MANKTLLAQIKQRSDTAANWTAKNPVISDGELIIVTTNAGEKRFKVGDGEQTFTQLPYADENILSKIKTYTAGDGISISDTGVISSTGGGSGSNAVVNVTTGPLDTSTHIYSNCSSPITYTLLKTALDQHMSLEIVMNNDITMPVIETSQGNNSISLTGIYTNYYIKFTWDSSNNIQGFSFGRPIISDYDELYSNSGAVYWDRKQNKYILKDITSTTYKAGNGISISNDGTISVTAAKIYSGTSNAPSADLGENGDIYIQTEG